MLDDIQTFREKEVDHHRSPAARTCITRTAAAWTNAWACTVIQHVKDRGSNIRTFAMSRHRVYSSTYLMDEDLFIDADGQLFPRYTYDAKADYDYYADLVLQPEEEQPPLWYKAVPIRDVKRERPGERILFHQFETWPLVRWKDCSTVKIFP